MDRWVFSGFLRRGFFVAVWPLMLVFIGGLPLRQGVMIGLLMAFLFFLVSEDRRVCRFVPYWVRVTPDWCQILTDYKLISSPEEWRTIQESATSSAGYNMLRDGVLFTVVQQDGEKAPLWAFRTESDLGWREVRDLDHALIFWNQTREFGSEFRFAADLTPLQFSITYFQTSDLFATLWSQRQAPRPDFFMALHYAYTENRRGTNLRPEVLASLDLGIEVPDGWWDRVRGSCAVPARVDSHDETHFVSLILGTIPLSEFAVYRDFGDWPTSEYICKTRPRLRKRRDAALQKFGWLEEKQEDGRQPTTIWHKYFTVRHHAI